MKTLVAYYSKTGKTKKVAEAIFGEIEGEKEIIPIDKVESAEGYDVLFLGFPVQGNGPDMKTVKFLEKNCTEGRNAALFITHASPGNAPELAATIDKFHQAAGGANIIGTFDCQGQLAKPIKIMMSLMPSPNLRKWAKNDTSQGQPDEASLDRARAFARGVMRKLSSTKANPEPGVLCAAG